MDVTSEKPIKQVLSKINNLGGEVDNLINNAAIDAKIKTGKNIKFENLKLEQWNKEISVGLTGTMLCSKIFGSEMVKKIKGSIVNIASDLSVIAPNQNLYKIKNQPKFIKPITYSAIKHGILGLTNIWHLIGVKTVIKANSLSPGPVLNDQSLGLQKKLKKKFNE